MRKNIFREIRSTLGRFIAIFAISALGAGFFAGLRATGPDMKATADIYYSDNHLMDYRLLSTLGFTEEDVDALRALDGIEEVLPTWGMDVLVEYPEGSEAARFSALPAEGQPQMNRPVLVEGRLPEAAGECAVDSMSPFGLSDEITLSAENDEDTLDMMTTRRFTVVGRVDSPAYISFQRGNTNIGNGRLSFYAYTTADAFDSEVYTEIFLTARGAQGLSAFSDAYEQLIDDGVLRLEGLGESRAPIRYDEVVAEGNAELADAREKVADGKAEIADAEEQLADAEKELVDGEAELADGRAELADAERKLADAEKEIADGEAELADGRATLRQGEDDYAAGEAAYKKGLAEYQTNKNQIDRVAAGVAGISGAVNEAGQMLAASPTDIPGATGKLQQAMAGAGGLAIMLEKAGGQGAQLAAGINDILAQAQQALEGGDPATAWYILNQYLLPLQPQMDAVVAAAQKELAAGKKELDAAEEELKDARKKLDDGWRELADAEQKLADGRKELEDGRREVADARRKLADAEVELADGRAEYQSEKAKADREIADAREDIAQAEVDIADGQKKLDELDAPEWFVRTREDNPGYTGFASDTGRIDALAVTIPVFFFLVAALVCLTTMTRMVEEQRTLIGAFSALGYHKRQIAFKYLFYAISASATGAVAGVLAGFVLFPTAIWQAYGMMYLMPPIDLFNGQGLALVSVAFCVLTTGVATLAACMGELRSVPASLMRPKPPRSGKRVFLERIGPLWRRLSFMQKVTVRNLARYKKRFFMTVIGVAGCTALLLTGFGLRDSISGIVPRQYGDIDRYDIAAALTEASAAGADTELNQLLPTYGQGLYVNQTLIEAKSENGSTDAMTVYLYVPESPEALPDFVSLHDRKTRQPVAFPAENGGVIITEKLADRLGLEVGDAFAFARAGEKPVETVVGGISENYLLNYVYVTPRQYQALLGEAPEYDLVLLNLDEGLAESTSDVLNALIKAQPVAGATDIDTYREEFTDMFASLNSVVWLIISAAGVLAFVVLYNLTNINITERQREIATLKVLGFHMKEVASYVYRENVILTLIGAAVGLVLGVFLHDYVIITAEVDEVMFRRVVEPMSYVYSVVFTLLCAGLVNLVMMRRLRKVNMVESLKSIE